MQPNASSPCSPMGSMATSCGWGRLAPSAVSAKSSGHSMVTGRTVLEPGEGVLIGLERGVPRWWIDADRVSRAFRERRSIIVTGDDLLTQHADKVLTRDCSRYIPPRASPA